MPWGADDRENHGDRLAKRFVVRPRPRGLRRGRARRGARPRRRGAPRRPRDRAPAHGPKTERANANAPGSRRPAGRADFDAAFDERDRGVGDEAERGRSQSPSTRQRAPSCAFAPERAASETIQGRTSSALGARGRRQPRRAVTMSRPASLGGGSEAPGSCDRIGSAAAPKGARASNRVRCDGFDPALRRDDDGSELVDVNRGVEIAGRFTTSATRALLRTSRGWRRRTRTRTTARCGPPRRPSMNCAGKARHPSGLARARPPRDRAAIVRVEVSASPADGDDGQAGAVVGTSVWEERLLLPRRSVEHGRAERRATAASWKEEDVG